MHLEALLDTSTHPTGYYLPGTDLTGFIACRRTEDDGDRILSSIECTIEGVLASGIMPNRLTTAENRSTKFAVEEVRLFSIAQRIACGNLTLRHTSQCSFPFRIQIPLFTRRHDSDDEYSRPASRCTYSVDYPLPPTFSPLHLAGKCYIRYQLKCKIHDADGSLLKERNEPFRVLNVSRTSQPPIQEVDVDFPLVFRRGGRRGWFSSRSGDAPLFQACLHMPRGLAIAQSGQLFVSISRHNRDWAVKGDAPLLVLTSLHVVLHRVAQITSQDLTDTSEAVAAELFHDRKMDVTLSLDGRPACVKQNMRILPENLHAARLVPDFSLPHIHLTHKVTVIARILHWQSQRTFTMKLDTPFTVLPPEGDDLNSASIPMDPVELPATSAPRELATKANTAELPVRSKPTELWTKANVPELPARYRIPELPAIDLIL